MKKFCLALLGTVVEAALTAFVTGIADELSRNLVKKKRRRSKHH